MQVTGGSRLGPQHAGPKTCTQCGKAASNRIISYLSVFCDRNNTEHVHDSFCSLTCLHFPFALSLTTGTGRTPQWREGPARSQDTLCNACGVKLVRKNRGVAEAKKRAAPSADKAMRPLFVADRGSPSPEPWSGMDSVCAIHPLNGFHLLSTVRLICLPVLWGS